jgi:hypothetical protein
MITHNTVLVFSVHPIPPSFHTALFSLNSLPLPLARVVSYWHLASLLWFSFSLVVPPSPLPSPVSVSRGYIHGIPQPQLTSSLVLVRKFSPKFPPLALALATAYGHLYFGSRKGVAPRHTAPTTTTTTPSSPTLIPTPIARGGRCEGIMQCPPADFTHAITHWGQDCGVLSHPSPPSQPL